MDSQCRNETWCMRSIKAVIPFNHHETVSRMDTVEKLCAHMLDIHGDDWTGFFENHALYQSQNGGIPALDIGVDDIMNDFGVYLWGLYLVQTEQCVAALREQYGDDVWEGFVDYHSDNNRGLPPNQEGVTEDGEYVAYDLNEVEIINNFDAYCWNVRNSEDHDGYDAGSLSVKINFDYGSGDDFDERDPDDLHEDWVLSQQRHLAPPDSHCGYGSCQAPLELPSNESGRVVTLADFGDYLTDFPCVDSSQKPRSGQVSHQAPTGCPVSFRHGVFTLADYLPADWPFAQ